MKFIVTLSLVVVICEALPNSLSISGYLEDEWKLYTIKYEKKYEKGEEYSRRRIWEEKIRYIQEHNIHYNLGKHTYFLSINQFSDLTHEEFKTKYLTFIKPIKGNSSISFIVPLNTDAMPATVNWVTKGYVTAVKDQGACGSCWAFSTTGSMEGQYFRKTNHLLSFSEQQLVDCSKPYGNEGCLGGLMIASFEYIKDKGIETEQDYPYTKTETNCQYNAAKVVTKVNGFVNIKENDEHQLSSAVATQGPISVGIDASHESFQSYGGGIYDEPACSSSDLDHGVLAVGYGSENGINYWLIKNSWSDSWGLKGYIKMSKDKNNQCGIASAASYPTL